MLPARVGDRSLVVRRTSARRRKKGMRSGLVPVLVISALVWGGLFYEDIVRRSQQMAQLHQHVHRLFAPSEQELPFSSQPSNVGHGQAAYALARHAQDIYNRRYRFSLSFMPPEQRAKSQQTLYTLATTIVRHTRHGLKRRQDDFVALAYSDDYDKNWSYERLVQHWHHHRRRAYLMEMDVKAYGHLLEGDARPFVVALKERYGIDEHFHRYISLALPLALVGDASLSAFSLLPRQELVRVDDAYRRRLHGTIAEAWLQQQGWVAPLQDMHDALALVVQAETPAQAERQIHRWLQALNTLEVAMHNAPAALPKEPELRQQIHRAILEYAAPDSQQTQQTAWLAPDPPRPFREVWTWSTQAHNLRATLRAMSEMAEQNRTDAVAHNEWQESWLPMSLTFDHDVLEQGYKHAAGHLARVHHKTQGLPEEVAAALRKIARWQAQKHLGHIVQIAWHQQESIIRPYQESHRESHRDGVSDDSLKSARYLKPFLSVLAADDPSRLFIENWAREHLRAAEQNVQKGSFLLPPASYHGEHDKGNHDGQAVVLPAPAAIVQPWLNKEQQRARALLAENMPFLDLLPGGDDLAFWRLLGQLSQSMTETSVRQAFLGESLQDCARFRQHEHQNRESFMVTRHRQWAQTFGDGTCMHEFYGRYHRLRQRFQATLASRYPFAEEGEDASIDEVLSFFVWARGELAFLYDEAHGQQGFFLSAAMKNFLVTLEGVADMVDVLVREPIDVRVDVGDLSRSKHLGNLGGVALKVGSRFISVAEGFRWRAGAQARVGLALRWRKGSRWLPLVARGEALSRRQHVAFTERGPWALFRFYERYVLSGASARRDVLRFPVSLGLAADASRRQGEGLLPRQVDVMMKMDIRGLSLVEFLRASRTLAVKASNSKNKDSVVLLN
ncbi:MAG: hypothetical protein GDA50_07205 [Alphaproteobacteria bacterium GM202ARS2]|nr:hypothetical protein [Alphaproteobacteria bacterium GM202ARS2]